MTKGLLGQHLILISASDSVPPNEAFLFELLDDSLDGTLGDANSGSNFTQHQVGLTVQDDQNVSMIGQEGPRLGVVTGPAGSQANSRFCRGRPLSGPG